MKRNILIVLILFLSIGNVMALDTLGTFQLDNTVNLIQGCDNSTYSNITRILYPDSTFALDTEVVMTRSGDNYNYTFTNTEIIGDYLVFGHCDEDGVDEDWVYDFAITHTGDKVSLSNSIIVIVFIFLAGLFLTLGYSFSKEHWILKTFFNFCAVGMGILAVNSAKIIASESTNLGIMGTVGLTVMVISFSLFFIYMFIYAFIEIIKAMKEKKGVRWNYD